MQNLRFLSLFLALLFLVNYLPVALAARFVDLNNNWAQKYINTLSDRGVISSESDGKFKPGNPVTRAVLCIWLVKVTGLDKEPIPSNSSFADVTTNDWYYRAAEIAWQNNYIASDPTGLFHPNQTMQRGEVISILAHALNLTTTPDNDSIQATLSQFKDASSIPVDYRIGIAEASQAGILVNYPNSRLVNASQIATRDDTASLLYQLQEHFYKQQVYQSTNSNPSSPSIQPSLPSYDSSNTTNPAQSTLSSAYSPSGNYYSPSPAAYSQPYSSPSNGPSTYQSNHQPSPTDNSYLQGQAIYVNAGAQFQATLSNSIDSETSQPGEAIQATLVNPLYSNGTEAVPAGSKIIGNITQVISARRFRFGKNGEVDIHFTTLETPDGHRFPLSASINTSQLNLTGGTTGGRWGKGLLTTGAGALGGAALGTGLGAIVGATSYGRVGRATGMGAIFGTAIGGGVGLVGAGVRKGSEVKLRAGTTLPVQLAKALPITSSTAGFGTQPQQPPSNNSVQQPYGGMYPQP